MSNFRFWPPFEISVNDERKEKFHPEKGRDKEVFSF